MCPLLQSKSSLSLLFLFLYQAVVSHCDNCCPCSSLMMSMCSPAKNDLLFFLFLAQALISHCGSRCLSSSYTMCMCLSVQALPATILSLLHTGTASTLWQPLPLQQPHDEHVPPIAKSFLFLIFFTQARISHCGSRCLSSSPTTSMCSPVQDPPAVCVHVRGGC